MKAITYIMKSNRYMKHFWTHKDNIPEGLGYGQFTPGHFGWLSFTFVLVLAFTLAYRHAGLSSRILLLRSTGALLIMSDIVKMFVLARSDVKFTDYLPLEICSFGAYFIVLDSVWYDHPFFLQMLLILFLPAAIMAVIFPTTTPLPVWNFFTIHQFLFHGLIIAYVTARFVCGEIPLDYPNVLASIAKILVLVGIMYVVDTVFDKDFMFLRDPYGNPLLKLIWDKTKGGFAYTVGLICFSIFVVHVFYLLFKVIALLFIRPI